MNQFRSVVDQTHGGLTRQSGTAQAIDVGNMQAIESQMRFLDLDKKLLPPPRRLKREFDSKFLFRFADAFQQRTQSRRYRHGERPAFSAFRRRKRDFVFLEINAVDRNPRFTQLATGVKGNIKSRLQPFRFIFQRYVQQKLGIEILNDIIWEKPNPPPTWPAASSPIQLELSSGPPAKKTPVMSSITI